MHQKQRAESTEGIQSGPSTAPRSSTAFCLFAAANLTAAIFSPIQDCDEVFNYWEPTHYLNHGYGLQTWEYSPEYAIRSWAYTGLHASIIQLWRVLPLGTKVTEFYFLRIVLAMFCALCETRFYSTIARTLHPRVAIFFLMAMTSSPGMYHASPAYLPSSFAMCTAMLGFSAFMDLRGGVGAVQGIFWFACGTLLGWPFAGALILPFLLEHVMVAVSTGNMYTSIKTLFKGGTRCLMLLALQTGIDSLFYRRLVCVPLNIVMYNVFTGGSKGPNIYGVEPWHYYLRNLALNFNAWLVLALAAFPMLILQQFVRQKPVLRQSYSRNLVFLTPFYLWLGIFTLQPHKEERFMYPAYPALAFNAAVSLHLLLSNLGSTKPSGSASKIPAQLKLAVVTFCVMGAFNLGALRTVGLMTAYSAPLTVYAPLQAPEIASQGANVCLGKEWYRFPSSYFLPHNIHTKFIKSEFSGLLPGEFGELPGWFPGTWMLPSGMNDENREDPGKYTDISDCEFLVDSYFAGASPSSLEPTYVADTENWEQLSCSAFLNVDRTSLLGRLLWIPDLPFIPERVRRKWGQYCLLRRRGHSEKW